MSGADMIVAAQGISFFCFGQRIKYADSVYALKKQMEAEKRRRRISDGKTGVTEEIFSGKENFPFSNCKAKACCRKFARGTKKTVPGAKPETSAGINRTVAVLRAGKSCAVAKAYKKYRPGCGFAGGKIFLMTLPARLFEAAPIGGKVMRGRREF